MTAKSGALKERSPYWDNIKGLLIILVVVGHFLWGYKNIDGISNIVLVIYTFHMPAFIFVSGFLSNPKKAFDPGNILTILVSYFLINTMIMAYSYFVLGSAINLIKPYYSYWYLLALMVWRFLQPAFLKHKILIFVSAVLSMTVGFAGEIDNTFALARIISFSPYFFLGSWLAHDGKELFAKKKSLWVYFAGAAVLVGAGLLTLYSLDRFGINTSDQMMQKYNDPLVKDFLKRGLIHLLAILWTLGICLVGINKKIPLITKWGRNSLTIYLFHRILALVFLKFFPKKTYEPMYFWLALAGSLITLLICGNDTVNRLYSNMVSRIVAVFRSRKPSDRVKKYALSAIVLAVVLIAMAEPVLH